MKSHLTKLSLALLSTVFLLGCQDQGSGPAGPDGLGIQARRSNGKGGGNGSSGDNPGSLTYSYTFSEDGAIAIDGFGTAKPTAGKDQAGEVRLDGVGSENNDDKLILNDALIAALSGADCFPVTKYAMIGTLRPDKKDAAKVDAIFNFTAKGKDGSTEFDYVLRLDGMVGKTTDEEDNTVEDAIFPPEPGQTTTVDFNSATMGTKGGKDNSAVACTGDVTPTLTAHPTSVMLKGTS